MHKENDVLNKTKEIPEIADKNGASDVHRDQQSMFETSEAFSESMVVEKSDVEVNSAFNEAGDLEGDTAVFDIAESDKDIPNAAELQSTAKEYYGATHSDSIEGKINEIRNHASEVFVNDKTSETDKVKKSDDEETDEEDLKKKKKELKKAKKEKKRRKKGYISNNDMELLMNGDAMKEVAEVFAKTAQDLPVVSSEASSSFDEEEASTAEIDAVGGTENVLKTIGASQADYKSFEEVFEADEPEEEYTDRSEETAILKKLRKKAIFSMLSIVLTVLFAGVCIYFELAAGTKMAHFDIFEPAKNPVIYGMSLLQLMFFGIMVNLDGVKRAFLGLRPRKPAVEGYAAIILTVCTLHNAVSCFVAPDRGYVSFCSVGCIALVVLSINSFIKAQTALSAFCIAASKLPKYSLAPISKGSVEEENFQKYLDPETTLFAVHKSDFINGFFKKQNMVPSAGKGTLKMVVAILVIAAALGGVCGFFGSIYTGVIAFTTVCLVALPANALISTALPFLLASSKAKKVKTAFIGEAACDAYEKMGVVSFDDTEVFPPKSVKVSSIRTYGDNRIDKVILYMAKIFDKVPGPLSHVFANSVQNLEDLGTDARITDLYPGGIVAKIDGKEIIVGTGDFLRLYDMETPLDNIDDSFTRSMGSIMFMAVGGNLAAKFYIKYAINRNFEALLHSFYDAGICVGIRTLDPCVSDELVCGNLKGSNYPISVIKVHPDSLASLGVSEDTDSAIVSVSSLHNFLRGFIRLDRLRNVYRFNTIIGLISTIVGLGLAAFFNLTGGGMSVLFLLAFQLLWCVPTVIFSLFSK